MDAVALALLSAALFGGDDGRAAARARPWRRPVSSARSSRSHPRSASRSSRRRSSATGDVAAVWPFALAGILAPGVSQILFTVAIRDAGPVADVGHGGDGAALRGHVRGRSCSVSRSSPASSLGSVLIVGGGVLLASESGRPDHVKAIGLVFALAGGARLRARVTRSCAGSRSTPTSRPSSRSAPPCSPAADDPPRRARRPPAPELRRAARLPARRAALRALVRLALRGVLPRAAQRRRTARGHRVAVGRRAVGALPAPLRAGRPGGSCRRALVVVGGILIGLTR